MTTIINAFGKMAGWNSVTCRLFGRDVVGIRKIAYDDEKEIDNEYGAGDMPVGESEGNYKAKASIELTIEERLAIQDSLPKGMRIQDIPAFPIVVAYEYQGRVYKDVIHNCRFKNNGIDVKQGDKTISTDHTLNCSHINWNV
ncbi:MAG: hypothetical protein COS42_00390 [Flavobacteriales bacterium CG03_land_8_20_14_0_80_35_15]|nr:MAG: hypothetical protein COS42_00390 [Flavobacteriales bacterium CG03_land_8_20_14_0_80_35_15]PIX07087.1 MAG: hypothetical protein COZ76_05380 [Flavobacteriales bacterium CG_4_8_14_3_um_filter_35_10]